MTQTYDSRTIHMHWASALLVVALWLVAQSIDFLPRGTPRMAARSIHITLGVLLAVLLAARVAWRLRSGTKLPRPDAGVLGRLAVSGHHLLYAMLTTAVVIGAACVWIRGDTWFNLFTVPAFDPGNKSLRRDAVELHGLVTNALLVVAGLHAAIAIWHHWIRRDGVLQRMWPSLRGR